MTLRFGKLCAALTAVLFLAAADGAWAMGTETTTSAPSMPKADDYAAGVKSANSGDYADALSQFNKVVASDPKNADAWNMIGFTDRKLGKFPDSLSAYEKALAINPGHLGANEYLGELYLQMGDMPKAEAQLARLDQLCSGSCDEYKTLKGMIDAKKKSS
jgi:tetratricopeptide (TPR) repeat protein